MSDKHDRPKALSQSSIIEGTASLPTSILESIQFSVGHYPTQNPNQVTTTTTASPTAGAKSSPVPSSSPPTPTAEPSASASGFAGDDPSSESGLGLSPSAKIGAIAGGVAGGLLLGLLFAGFLCLRRRRQKRQLQREEEEARAVEDFMHGETKSGAASEPDPLSLGITAGGSAPSAASSPDTPAPSELDSKAARPWSLRSELDNDSSARSSYSNGHGGGHGGGVGQARPAPSELAAHPIAELPG
ncbi:hypothetical protein UCDDA912_g06531 [Diaporthe ampelina]|uniref:Uncharacterized protein n=1 Tax=Diaporthe ampelina TaxID=1214573 RepID=A0A0G2I017_9PEZI|nr:hypothetical protein UCDDA912_g06531 [Diaporthe ampelina]